MPTPSDNDVLRMDGWPKGANNRLRETESQAATRNQFEIPSSPWLRSAVNVDLTKDGHPLRRQGFQRTQEGYMHSLWGDPSVPYALAVKDATLTLLTPEATPLVGVHPYARVAYAAVNGDVYWSNGSEKGRVRMGGVPVHWGLPLPAQPTLSVAFSGGGLWAGTYQVCTTYVDEDSEEGGACAAQTVEVAEGDGIAVTVSAPQAPAVRTIVYVTGANGEDFTRTYSLAGAATVTVTAADIGRGMRLETQHLRAPSPSTLVRVFNGRIYGARDEMVWFTEPLRYSLARPSQGVYLYPTHPTLLEPVRSGMFVGGAFGVYFLAGRDPYDATQIAVSAKAPIPRAVTRVPGDWLGQSDSSLPAWWTQDGGMQVGMPDGTVQDMTADRLGIPQFQYGAMLVREREGMRQVVSVLGRGGEISNAVATDSVVTEVRRNCVRLN